MSELSGSAAASSLKSFRGPLLGGSTPSLESQIFQHIKPPQLKFTLASSPASNQRNHKFKQMFISLPVTYAALVLLASGVSGLPKRDSNCDDDNFDLVPRAKTLCSPGNWYNSTGAKPKCEACPAGYTCNGHQDPQSCDYGTYQPNVNSTTCIATVPGFYQDKEGQNASLPCYLGSYQPYGKQSFCYGAPSGRFQGQTGQKAVCGACCGWYTKLENFNTKVYKCPSNAPYSGEASGSGCQTTKQGCTPVGKCAQKANGACPDQTF
ncbi:hypothetical protein B0H16DRAFT_1717245 [Mycena metata]|uniref:Uncharacterized protein n=1 Tax=Mycena metata TaxID=1033252 RepID=A0AAD7JLA8_9AGAR|nr:hypothetical protein B0H16DRAFT_1717245 [Mycena metata]